MNNTLWLQRRSLLLATAAAATLALAGCATQSPSLAEAPPIVFVHGNGDTAALWQTTVWRFESNGWPRERLWAIDQPYPVAQGSQITSLITVTNLGDQGVEEVFGVIHPPQVAIVGFGGLVERPVVRGGAIVVRQMMNLSSSFDHRVVDGADAAAFIQAVRGVLEAPGLLFVE